MRTILLSRLLAAALTAGSASATLITAEYFIDEDPGQGMGISLQVPIPGPSASIVIDVPAPVLAGLGVGIHRMGVRFQDGGGDWSETIARTFRKDAVPVTRPPLAIVAAEYFIDVDPGRGLGTPVAVDTTGNPVSLGVAVSPAQFAELTMGTHRLAVRSLDNEGNWSETFARTFGKDSSAGPPERFIERIDYQWHAGGGPIGVALSTQAPSGAAAHSWMPEFPMPHGVEGDVFQLIVTPYDTRGGRGDTVSRNVKLAPAPALAEVLAQAFPGASPEDLEPGGNPLGDTLNNLQKYYLGLDPTRRTGSQGLSMVAVDSQGAGGPGPPASRSFTESQGRVALHHTRNRYARNVRGTVETSFSLAGDSWIPVDAVEEVTALDPYTDRVTLRPIPNPDGAGRQFFRLKVVETP